MRAVFLSYRRDDTQTVTGFIYHHLTTPTAFGPDGVFMDIDTIPIGVDFRQVIDEHVSRCRFFLVVIGPRWLTQRLQQEGDFVRLEVEAALRRGIPVVPVLVDGAAMPNAEELPESIRQLAFQNATTLRPGRQFAADIERLVKGLHDAEVWMKRKGEVAPPKAKDQAGVAARATSAVPLSENAAVVTSPIKANQPIKVNCTNCNRTLHVDSSGAGKRGRCPHCKNVLSIPVPAGVQPPPPADGQLRCPKCTTVLHVPSYVWGNLGKCPTCATIIRFPPSKPGG